MAASILVVEDDPAVALALEVALKGEGYLPLLAATGDKGLEIGLAQAPDLLILDVRLPGIDGFELLRRLRAGGSKAPVIILTAHSEPSDLMQAVSLGSDAFLTKPASDVETLAEDVWNLIEELQAARERWIVVAWHPTVNVLTTVGPYATFNQAVKDAPKRIVNTGKTQVRCARLHDPDSIDPQLQIPQ